MIFFQRKYEYNAKVKKATIGTEGNLTMVIVKRLIRTNNVVKVSVHQFINNVNIIEGILSWRSYDIPNSNYLRKTVITKQRNRNINKKRLLKRVKKMNIFMVHVAKELNLPQSPFSVNDVVKGVSNLLYGNFLMRIAINSSTERKKRIA